MIISVDCETRGLDATKFITGCLISEEKPDIAEIFDTKEALWNRILELGRKQEKKKKTLQVYAHNHSYDFYAYAKLDDSNIKWFSHSPFINAYLGNDKKEIIKFLDSYAIYTMSLAKMAKLHNMKKTETPNILKTGRIPNKKELFKIKEYMIQDTKIVLQSILLLKKKMKEENITVRRLYTINQIAINHLINTWRNDPLAKELFWDIKAGELHKTWKPQIIHEAYRGGRVQAFQTGKYKNCHTIDINSLYPWSATQIDFPQLKEMHYSKDDTLPPKGTIGIIKCMIYNKNNEIGLLPVRTPSGSYYPKKGRYLIGTWTLEEIHTAIEEGYKIIDIEWTYTYKQNNYNPFIKHMTELYNKRTKNNDTHDKYFYKQMMNSSIGKLAQTKTNQEIIIDSVEKTKEYLDKNYKILRGIDYNYVYQKDLPKVPKKYYCPILPTLINAKARLRLYNELKKIAIDDILYCDTDSITLKNFEKYKHLFEINKELGNFKIEHENIDVEIVARKTYKLGDTIKISGIHQHEKIAEEWKKGIVTNKKMITIKSNLSNIKEAGKFIEETRDLKKQAENNQQNQDLLEEEVILIDENIEDISYFLPIIKNMIEKK